MAPTTRNWHQKNAKIALFILWREKRQFYISIFYCLQLVLHYKWYKLTLEVASICKKALPSSNFDVHDYPSNHSWLEVSHFSSNVSLKFVKISRPWRVHLRLQKPPKKVVQWVQIRWACRPVSSPDWFPANNSIFKLRIQILHIPVCHVTRSSILLPTQCCKRPTIPLMKFWEHMIL